MLKRNEITTGMLNFLYVFEQDDTMTIMAEKLNGEWANVYKLYKKLETKDIFIVTEAEDSNSKHIRLNDKGLKLKHLVGQLIDMYNK